MQKINIKNISYILDSGETLFSGVSFGLQKGDRVGVIGRNGSGKTTLLKILAGELKESGGQVEITKSIYTVPQQKDSDETELKNMSGGEFIRYHINKAKSMNPEVLLLDEPTNHLDEKGRVELQEYIDLYQGTLVFVSHDEDFLKQNAKTIFHIFNKSMEVFGGGYEEWQESFQEYLDGIERQKSALKKEERKLKEAKLIEHKRSEKVKQKAKKEKHEVSKDKMSKGFFKDNSQFSHGKINAQIEKLQERNSNNQSKYELPKDLDVSFIFPESDSKKSLLIKIENGNLKIGNRELINDYNFEIYYGDKVLLKGDNGSGKSLLVKSLTDKNVEATHTFYKPDLKIAYLDQFYNIVEKDKTILDNVLSGAPDIQVARKVLSLYGFPDSHIVNQKADHLSGGEMCRLALAKISVTPLDLIVLDEPTNNIDIDTKEVLLNSLKKFKGAILIITHDIKFAAEMECERVLEIYSKKLCIQ
jgi:ATPase subunit of ABC transporter with duplicated ATPase domains